VSQVFPKWTNKIPTLGAPALLGGLVLVCAAYLYYVDNKFWMVGYEPVQPVDYSHQIHAGKLGMDCRYCHTHVEESFHANVPDTATCMNCHTADEASDQAFLNSQLWAKHKVNKNLMAVRHAFQTTEPVQWRRVHKVPDFVNFPHAVHVHAGVSCYSCHGRIDQLAVVRQNESLAMGWCLDCHRAPEKSLVDTSKIKITDLLAVQNQLASEGQAASGLELAKAKQLQPPQSCGACHY